MKNLKLWQKQYLATLLLFILTFYGCVFFLAHNSFSATFSSAQESAAKECAMILRAIQADRAIIAARGGASEAADSAIAEEYGEYYKRKGIDIRYIKPDDNAAGISNISITEAKNYGQLTLRQDKNGNNFFFMCSELGNGILVYSKYTNPLLDEQKQQNIILLGTAGIFTLALTLGLYFTQKQVHRPVDNLAHELRTPLTAINGYAQYIALAAINEEERFNAVSFIIEESRRLQDTVEKLLILSNLREGEPDHSKVSIEDLFQRIQLLYPGIHCRVEWPFVTGDAVLLGSLVRNLAENAVKIAENNSTVELISKEGCISVMDKGPGLSEEMMERLNDPNCKERTSETGGSGLGIPLCHQIAKLHNAELRFENRPDGGTVAKVKFLQYHNNSIATSKHRRCMMRKKQGGQNQ